MPTRNGHRRNRHHHRRAIPRPCRLLPPRVGGGELAEDVARGALLAAAARHVGVDSCMANEVTRAIDDGLGYGKRLPRCITR